MQLHGSKISPYVRHCRVVLMNSGLDFDFVETDVVQAQQVSPIAKIPYLYDTDIFLNDSSSILKYVRERSEQEFLLDIQDYDLFAVSNTVLDSVVNLFLLERSGLLVEQNSYLKRQQQRVESGLADLDKRVCLKYEGITNQELMQNDALLRVACFVQWAVFRQRIQVRELKFLEKLVEIANHDKAFDATRPELAL